MQPLPVLLVSVLLMGVSQCANILLMPVPHLSTVNFFSVIGATLEQNGHNVKVLTVNDYTKAVTRQGLTALVPDIPPPVLMSSDEGQAAAFQGTNPLTLLTGISKNALQFCIDFMENEAAMDMLTREKFDIVLIDSFDPFRCHYMFPYKLGLPYITVTARHDPWSVRIPAMPSMEAQFGLRNSDEHPSFLERLINLAAYCALQMIMPPSTAVDDSLVEKFIPEKPYKTFMELYLDSEMWLVNLEPVCLDFPRIQGLHYQYFGGLGTEPARPLAVEWEEFVNSATEGLIVVTFGSALKNIPLDIMNKMMLAFERLPQKVAMRYSGPDPDKVPGNVRLSKWLPQNDLLGQQQARLFITHAGNNGQLEALYHGVPMLAMPVFGDQGYNAKRAVVHGFGMHLDIFSFTPDELYDHINEVIGNPKYAESIRNCSAIFRSLPNPQKNLAFWVDHVLQFGGGHLKPQFMDMPLWQFFMLDVLLFLLVVTILSLLMCAWCCKKVARKCMGRREKARVKAD